MTPLALGALGLALAGPVPRALSRWPALRRTPVSAMLLWQSVALAAVLSTVGSGLSLATAHAAGPAPRPAALGVAAVAVALTGVVVARLLLSLHRTGTNLRRLRRRHRAALDLVAHGEDRLRVLDHPVPVAYCLPGMTGSRIVVSRSTQAALDDAALGAVLAHERSHLRWRHDLVLEAFSALHRAFPRGVSSERAVREVELLVEVLADRDAARVAGRRDLLRALVRLAPTAVPAGALGAGGTGLAVRADLLRDLRPHRCQALVAGLLAAAVLVLPTALVVLPWLTSLRAG